MSDAPRVQVAVRIRPVLKSGGSQLQQNERFALDCTTKLDDFTLRLQEQKTDDACRTSTFTFDYVFDYDSTQHEVYEDAVVDLIDAALCGCNTTILAYGQTGSGKTHTVLGEVKDNPLEQDLLTANTGMFMRSLRDLLEYKRNREKTCHVIIGLSCIEIYNEAVRDLLSDTPSESIKVVMDDESVYMPSLTTMEIVTLQSVYQIFKMANARRQTRATEANEGSSRSHCLFVIDLLQQEKVDSLPPPSLDIVNAMPNRDSVGPKKTGGSTSTTRKSGQTPPQSPRALNMEYAGTVIKRAGEPNLYASKIVFGDLAGSEKLKMSGATGSGLKEAVNINSSLTALGNVVHALFENSKHVPYRDSKLTRILRPAFNHPSARVLLLAALSPTQLTYDESVSTCHFANKVKAMKVVTSTSADSQNLIAEYFETVKVQEQLLADLRIARVTHNYHTLIRRGRPDLVSALTHIYKSPVPASAKHQQRAQILKELGLFDFAEKDKLRVAAIQRDEEAKEAAEIGAMGKKIRDNIVDDHNEAVNHITMEVNEIESDNTALRKELASSIGFIEAQAKQEEKEVADLTKQNAENSIKQQSLATELQRFAVDAENILKAIAEKQSKSTGGPLQTAPSDDGGDEYYAALTHYHLGTERFCRALLLLRHHQHSLYGYRRFNGELSQIALMNAIKLMDVLPKAAGEPKEVKTPTTTPASPTYEKH
eukprot:PhF_6_TR1017/c0_g1_i1/m.2039